MPGWKLSLVIAEGQDSFGLADCLQALASQRDADVEVIVVFSVPPHLELRSRFPWVRWLNAGRHLLIPQLWGLGMGQATGDIIAITTSQFTPANDWVETIREAHTRLEAPAIGGSIAPPRGGRASDWATYFLRYSAYFAYDREQAAPDLAGDNASYKRAAMDAYPNCWRDGFWEAELHQQLRAAGQSLLLVPQIRVTQSGSVGFWSFLQQRFRHGVRFGRSRMRQRSRLVRIMAIATSPLIPMVFFGKICGRVVRSGRNVGFFFYCAPVLVCFLLAWSLGEACGYLLALRSAEEESGTRSRKKAA